MNVNEVDRTEELFILYHEGGLSDNEMRDFEFRLDNDVEFLGRYEEWMKSYLKVEWSFVEYSIDKSVAKERLLVGLKKKRNVYRLFYVAASILIGVLLLIFAGREEKEVSLVATITPVNSKAVLFLDGGRIIELSGDGNVFYPEDCAGVMDLTGEGIVYHESIGRAAKHKIMVPRGGEYFVQLSDGTQIWLNSESELEYPVNFDSNVREVAFRGEGYFIVKKDSDRPFKVIHDECAITVYGTEFNFNTYHPERVELVLVTGMVGLVPFSGAPERPLVPKDLATVNLFTGGVSIRQADVVPYIAWKNNEMVFHDESLESILEKVSRWYDVDVVYKNEEVKNICFSMNTTKYSELEDLFYYMEKASDVRFIINHKTIEVY